MSWPTSSSNCSGTPSSVGVRGCQGRPAVLGRPGRALHQQPGGTGPAHGQGAHEDCGMLSHVGWGQALRSPAGPGRDRTPAGMEPPRLPATGPRRRGATAALTRRRQSPGLRAGRTKGT